MRDIREGRKGCVGIDCVTLRPLMTRPCVTLIIRINSDQDIISDINITRVLSKGC